jgi:DNA repair ATPase RecN
LGKRIPNEVKNKVLDKWLFGIPSNMIATCNGMGYGSVNRIIESFKSKIPDLDLLRAVAVMIKQEGLSLNDMAIGIRIKNFLEQMGSSEIEMESLLKEIDTHSFKTNQTFSDVVKEIHEIHRFASGHGISIHQVYDYVEHKKKELRTLQIESDKIKSLILKKKIEYHGLQ